MHRSGGNDGTEMGGVGIDGGDGGGGGGSWLIQLTFYLLTSFAHFLFEYL